MKPIERQGRKLKNKTKTKTAAHLKDLVELSGMINTAEQGSLALCFLLDERWNLNSEQVFGKFSLWKSHSFALKDN